MSDFYKRNLLYLFLHNEIIHMFGSNDIDGHIVVVRGFSDNDNIILNDPFGTPVEKESIRKTGGSIQTYGYYYNSQDASLGDNIIISRKDFEERFAKDTRKYLYIEGPLWQKPGGIETDFFVLPRVNPSNNQEKCIKQLQNYFGYNNTTKITLLTNDNTYTKGYFSRTLKGPYRHAGISVSNTTVGRICLWY